MNGAIFTDTHPATIITSACRGVARKIIPKRSRSYFGAAVAIISMAQQESPNVRDHMEDFRAHWATRSSGAIMAAPPGMGTRQVSISAWVKALFMLFPFNPPAPPGINETQSKQRDKNDHLSHSV